MKHFVLLSFTAVSLGLVAFACSEADDGSSGGAFGTDAGDQKDAASATTSDGGSTQMSTGSDSSAPLADAGAVGTAIVINEISGKGDEWIEILNASTGAIDVSGYGVTDGEKEGGAPKSSDIVTFPAGTVLSPNSYLIVGTAPSDAGAGASACPTGGQSYCVPSTFGISNKDGDNIYFVDKMQAIVDHVPYPPNTVATGQTWGRLANGTGTFQVNQPTPGAANKAP